MHCNELNKMDNGFKDNKVKQNIAVQTNGLFTQPALYMFTGCDSTLDAVALNIRVGIGGAGFLGVKW